MITWLDMYVKINKNAKRTINCCILMSLKNLIKREILHEHHTGYAWVKLIPGPAGVVF
jgi:hypothetical protein